MPGLSLREVLGLLLDKKEYTVYSISEGGLWGCGNKQERNEEEMA